MANPNDLAISDSQNASGPPRDAHNCETISPVHGPVLGNFRWVICGLLLFGTTKNYMDRNVLGVLNTTLQHDLGWTEIDYSNLVAAFQAAYAVGMLVAGRFIDRVGTRLGYAIAMIFWSLASMATALGSSLASFAAFRLALGLGEAGVGALGFLWLAFCLLIYRRPEECPRVSMEELHYIQSDSSDSTRKIKWSRLFPLRQTWAFAFGKFLIDPVWWFYLFWLPAFLQRKHGLSLQQIFFPIMVVYLISDAGSVAGGWISSSLIRTGKSINAARKTALLICAICVFPLCSFPMWKVCGMPSF
jgi:ACS family hexuronate transporter-like MFS transporter